MFDIGFWELGLIALIALLVLGPKRLPEAARTAGRWVARLRGFIANVKQDLDREFQAEELTELRKLKEELDQARQVIGKSSGDLMQDLADSAGPEVTPDYLVKALDDTADEAKTDKRETAPETKSRPKAAKRSKKKKAVKGGSRPSTRKRKAGSGTQSG